MLTSLTAGTTLGVLGALSALTNIIVELVKGYLPKVPTKIVTLIVAIIVCLVYAIMEMGFVAPALVFGIFGGFVVAYAAMNGFDTLKDITNRFRLENKGGGKNE